MIKSIFTVLFSVIVGFGFSQTVVKATSQGWAGGVCCATGTNYNLTLKLDHFPKSITLDSVLLKNYGNLTGRMLPVIQSDEGVFLFINFEIHTNKYNDFEEYKIEVKQNLREFNGQALIYLTINGKMHEVIVKEFEELMFLAYP